MSIAYNFLNLPMQISTPQGNIHFVYDATGRKWAKSAYAKASADETAYATAPADETAYAKASADKSGPEGLRWYVDNAEFLDGKIQHVAFQDGRFVAEYDENGTFQGTYRAEYYRTDHLGNTRLTFSDFNHDMVISPRISSGTPTAYDSEITSENHYYPFGLSHTGPWYASVAPENKYRYNGKEWNVDWGLGLYDFGNRWQDPALGRFTTVDRFAEKYAFQSAYVMAANDPVKFVDVNGDSIDFYTPDGKYLFTINDGKSKITGTYFQNVTTIEDGTVVYSNGINFQYNDIKEDRYRTMDGDFAFRVVGDDEINSIVTKGISSAGTSMKDHYNAGRHGGSLDYFGKEDSPIPPNMLTITTSAKGGTLAYNTNDFGNYLTGQSYRRLGYGVAEVRLGGHINNIINGPKDYGSRKAAGWVDSKADQRAIVNGYYHFTTKNLHPAIYVYPGSGIKYP